jgi:hypothetical protein
MITDIETQTSGPYLHVAARGGTRRERTAYGFLPATYATYGPR